MVRYGEAIVQQRLVKTTKTHIKSRSMHENTTKMTGLLFLFLKVCDSEAEKATANKRTKRSVAVKTNIRNKADRSKDISYNRTVFISTEPL